MNQKGGQYLHTAGISRIFHQKMMYSNQYLFFFTLQELAEPVDFDRHQS